MPTRLPILGIMIALGRDLAYAACLSEMAETAGMDRWRRWFEARGLLRHDPATEAAISRQCGGSERDVAEEGVWRRLGYTVHEGAKGFEVGQRRYYQFSEVAMQEGAQLIGIKYAQDPEGEVAPGSIEALEGLLVGAGWQVHWQEGDHGERAGTNHQLKSVRVEAGATPLATLNRLGHEAGHALLHHGFFGPQWEQESQAQLFAWMVARMLGCDLADYSLCYIFGWSEGRQILSEPDSERLRQGLAQVEGAMVAAGVLPPVEMDLLAG